MFFNSKTTKKRIDEQQKELESDINIQDEDIFDLRKNVEYVKPIEESGIVAMSYPIIDLDEVELDLAIIAAKNHMSLKELRFLIKNDILKNKKENLNTTIELREMFEKNKNEVENS